MSGSLNALAIDTATESLGVAAVSREGQSLAVVLDAGLRHAQSLAPWIERVLDELACPASRLDLVVCSRGPGSFTGVRIGMSTAKGLALGAGCPIVTVPSLDAIARRHRAFPGAVIPLIDAKRGRVYAAVYESARRRSEYLDVFPREILPLAEKWRSVLLAGPHAAAALALLQPEAEQAASVAQERRQARIALDPSHAYTDPRLLLEMGVESFHARGGDTEPISPLYLRPSEAELKRQAGH